MTHWQGRRERDILTKTQGNSETDSHRGREKRALDRLGRIQDGGKDTVRKKLGERDKGKIVKEREEKIDRETEK